MTAIDVPSRAGAPALGEVGVAGGAALALGTASGVVASSPDAWRRAWGDLKAFCAAHPRLRIDRRRISVPAELRPGFYAALDEAARALVRAARPGLAAETEGLVEGFRLLEEGFRRQAGIEETVLPHSLRAFLSCPSQALAGRLYGPLMGLLQEEGSSQDDGGPDALDAADALPTPLLALIDEAADGLHRAASELSLFYRLLWMLDPVQVRKVGFDASLRPTGTATTVMEPGQQQAFVQRRIPDTLVRARGGQWYSTKFELASEVGYYDVPILRRRDNTLAGDSQPLIGHRVLMVHRLSSADDVPTIADRDTGRLVAPTVVVEASSPEALQMPACRLALGNRAVTLRPECGYFVLLPAGSRTEGWFDEDGERIAHLPSVTFLALDEGCVGSSDASGPSAAPGPPEALRTVVEALRGGRGPCPGRHPGNRLGGMNAKGGGPHTAARIPSDKKESVMCQANGTANSGKAARHLACRRAVGTSLAALVLACALLLGACSPKQPAAKATEHESNPNVTVIQGELPTITGPDMSAEGGGGAGIEGSEEEALQQDRISGGSNSGAAVSQNLEPLTDPLIEPREVREPGK
ncbi:MAG: hypothetical protein LBL86_06565 [Coriobacteriales bacterium]|nr:hypothetical protein [Coriobacteriales bacterium]